MRAATKNFPVLLWVRDVKFKKCMVQLYQIILINDVYIVLNYLTLVLLRHQLALSAFRRPRCKYIRD